ncbi:hypothetical protein CHS0354_018446 [Potamilus streckersoni]|uniref:Metallo-beta-lactamase domain-containing protein n=1 Tax=Potamilus streckersoni TaxID=2493646 RepID=A0AAE0TAF2_9BIVA|nr:hypothetical protein CHS0354_018446 [Potamilus streckersoni]
MKKIIIVLMVSLLSAGSFTYAQNKTGADMSKECPPNQECSKDMMKDDMKKDDMKKDDMMKDDMKKDDMKKDDMKKDNMKKDDMKKDDMKKDKSKKEKKQKPQSVAAFLIKSGKTAVLVETGPDSCYPELEKQLKASGLSPADISAVFLTHIHFDHAGCAWRFARNGTKIYLHPNGFRHMANPEKLIESASRIYLDQMDVLWGKIEPIEEQMLVQVQDGERVTAGDLTMTAHFTPGHAKHHIVWQFGDSLFTGDVAGCRIGTGPAVAPTPPPDLDYSEWKKSIELMKALNPREIYLTHFGRFDDPHPHLEALSRQLDFLFNLSEAAFRRNEKNEVPAGFLDAFFEAYYRAWHIGNDAVTAYGNISPNWMNAQGLTRWMQKNLT